MDHTDLRSFTSIAPVARREFLIAGASLAAALAGCGTIARARLGVRLVNDPGSDEVIGILTQLVRTILPFEHPRFPPIAPDAVTARVRQLFPVHEPEFAGLRKGLHLYNELSWFDGATPVLLSEEERRGGAARLERARYAAFRHTHRVDDKRFVDLNLEAERAYLTLWMRSESMLRRRFARSAKAIVVVSAYSTGALWTALDYAGPLLPKTNAPA